MTVPAWEDLVSVNVTISQLRIVELDDLLGRDPV
jgi:FlaA1/EpsC-like NDP-sugar epimerase